MSRLATIDQETVFHPFVLSDISSVADTLSLNKEFEHNIPTPSKQDISEEGGTSLKVEYGKEIGFGITYGYIISKEDIQRRRNISEQLDVIAQRADNWDEYGSRKPSGLALNNTRHLMEELFDAVVSTKHAWLTPFISSDEEGNLTVAWHKGEHELHFEISADEVEYIKVWGIRIDTEMDVGVLNRDDYLTLWEWLLDG